MAKLSQFFLITAVNAMALFSTANFALAEKGVNAKIENVTEHGEAHKAAHLAAMTLFQEGEALEKTGAYARAADTYHQALKALSKQRHDPKFHLKIETALSRVRAKAGINQ